MLSEIFHLHQVKDLESEIVRYCRNRHSENRTLVGFYLPILGHEKHRKRIVSSQNIVDGDVPKAVGQFLGLVIALDIHPEVQTNVIGNPKFISIGIEHIFGVVELVVSYRESHRSTCLIYKVH